MHPSFVDADNEFQEIAREAAHLGRLLARLKPGTLERDSQEAWEAVHICASATEKIYTGCERVMASLAAEIDRAPISRADGWHAALLRRMANPYPGVRGAVISQESLGLLNKLRAFRHRERNAYSFSLDFEIVVERAGNALDALASFQTDVRHFFDGWPGQSP